MNLNDLSTNILFSTVQLKLQTKTGQKTGTAFIYSVPDANDPKLAIPVIITCSHVLEGATKGQLSFTKAKDGLPVRGENILVDFDPGFFTKANEVDLAVAPIGPVLNSLQSNGVEVFIKSLAKSMVPDKKQIADLAALEEIVVVGYPYGLEDQSYFTPLFRKGITATPVWSDFENGGSFLIDAGIYPGSSGSPVLILNQGSYPTVDGLAVGTRILLLGMVTQSTYAYETDEGPKTFINLGHALKMEQIESFIAKLFVDMKIQTRS